MILTIYRKLMLEFLRTRIVDICGLCFDFQINIQTQSYGNVMLHFPVYQFQYMLPLNLESKYFKLNLNSNITFLLSKHTELGEIFFAFYLSKIAKVNIKKKNCVHEIKMLFFINNGS